ncbi:DUF4266 domain-containing protein [Aliikangiella coralliicola]|uniref:DUF4266 domain-containing protein n=1 Tax=Aliikangiella coralliicola TaxID=2592383 RepID=A0A545U695_9GAMM|nr:DUF4266 domain-containing protein [Aliikangiella coralliicola]TQV84986.1 DUF4266 domain-containing protein [Aliikangiella coralliicola]
MKSSIRFWCVIGLAIILTGCSSMGVQPWERDLLSKQVMAINSFPVDQATDEHIYFSKEASSGGKSFAGGGCGCN